MILFISDLHLCASRPESTAAFERFIQGPAQEAEELWILGDLFEFWVGDDDLANPFHAHIADTLHQLARRGVRISIICGNRDFLLGKHFARRAGARIVAEPALLESPQGARIILTHGDAQCTDDLAYQRFRRRIRSPLSRTLLKLLPLKLRRALAARMRERSESMHGSSATFHDLNVQALESLFREHSATLMIHGHTHRPDRHELRVDGRVCSRWVLADWHAHASWLELGPSGIIPRSEQGK